MTHEERLDSMTSESRKTRGSTTFPSVSVNFSSNYNLNFYVAMFRRPNILFFAAVMLICAYVYADNCTKPHETDHICGEMCAATCKNPNPNPRFCPRIVCVWNVTSNCRCEEDYYRDTDSGNCYLLKDCPQ